MLKKIAIPILTSVLVLSACGNEGEPGNGGESGAATGEDTVELDVTWRYAGDPDNIGSYVNDFKEYYEEQQDTAIINPASVTASEGDYFSNVSLSLQSADTAPEILSQDTFMISSDANAGYLVNLDDRVEEWDEWDNFIGNVTEGVLGEDGSVYGIPTTTDSRGIWYNKNVFEEAGLDQEWQPTTWDEILEAGETIRDNTDAVPFAMNVASVNGEAVTMQTFQMFLYGTGETMYDEENEQWNVNGEGILDSLTPDSVNSIYV